MACKIYSQPISNNLVVLSEQGLQFTLFVNEEKINFIPESIIKVFNIKPGWQKIEIKFGEGKDSSLVDSVCVKAFAKKANKELTYIITEELKNNKLKYKLVFVSESDFSGPKSPLVPEAPVEKIILVDNNLYGNLYQAKDNKPVFFKNYIEENRGCRVVLKDEEIEFAINLFNKTNDIADRFSYLETTIQQNCYTTNQLIQLLNLYEIEMEKLKMAEKAHWHLNDRNNAAALTSAFKFDAIKNEYLNFLKKESNKNRQENLKCAVPISESEFDLIFNSISKTKEEYDKIKVAKKEVIVNCYSTNQIAKIMELFLHDREKMDFAYAAQKVVTDKENFSKLADGIQFSENKTEFLKVISKHNDNR